MLRIYFTPKDVLRIRVTEQPDPMWELALSLHVLRGHVTWPTQLAWRGWARHRLRDTGLSTRMHLVSSLVPVKGNFPDFLTPVTAGPDFEAGLESILSAGQTRLSNDLSAAFAQQSAPPWVRKLSDGDRASLNKLCDTLRDYFNTAIRPHWPKVHHQVTEDHVLRTRHLTTGGAEKLFNSLPAPIKWRWPVLETNYPENRTLHLDGRGLTLIPSYFCFGNPITFIDPGLPPVLVYPAHKAANGVRPGGGKENASKRLAALLGHTRAQVLLALQTPSSTSGLARQIDASLASASQHTTILREAGLITSTRLGKAVLHSLTPLGRELVGTNDQPSAVAPGDHRGAGRPGPRRLPHLADSAG